MGTELAIPDIAGPDIRSVLPAWISDVATLEEDAGQMSSEVSESLERPHILEIVYWWLAHATYFIILLQTWMAR